MTEHTAQRVARRKGSDQKNDQQSPPPKAAVVPNYGRCDGHQQREHEQSLDAEREQHGGQKISEAQLGAPSAVVLPSERADEDDEAGQGIAPEHPKFATGLTVVQPIRKEQRIGHVVRKAPRLTLAVVVL